MSSATLRRLVIPAVVLGVLLIVVAIVYFAEPAKSLPAFFPGHVSASSSEANHHHSKHGIAALVVALACFAFAWFQTGPKGQTAGTSRSGAVGEADEAESGAPGASAGASGAFDD
jgi:Na+/H+ antiporter NhaD/arsenite permease-like protein